MHVRDCSVVHLSLALRWCAGTYLNPSRNICRYQWPW